MSCEKTFHPAFIYWCHNTPMEELGREKRTEVKNRSRAILVACCLVAMFILAAGMARPAGNVNGAYKVAVAGNFEGSGVAAVGGRRVNINCEVRDSDGRRGRLQAHLPMVNNRFNGTGTVMGQAMIISGRVDPPDQEGEVVRKARVYATFTAGEDVGRIAGSRQGGGN